MVAPREASIVALIMALGLMGSVARAEETKADVTGNWKWTQRGRQGGQEREIVLSLKQEGDKVTGSIPGRQGGEPIEIEDGKITGDTISFTITRERNGNKFVMKYSGKVEGDTITGKVEGGREGAPARDWKATRETKS